MLKDVVKKNNEIIEENLKRGFGPNYEVKVNWGYPLCLVNVTSDKEGVSTSIKVVINMETEDYNLTILGSKTTEISNEDGSEKSSVTTPEQVSIDKNTIVYIMESAQNLTEQLSVSKNILENEKRLAEEAAKKESEEIEEVEAEIIEEPEPAFLSEEE